MNEAIRQRFSIQVEYDGTDFVGWQLQSNGRSVQGEIEAAFQKRFNTFVRIHGAGRTDTGVHATGQVAHFDFETRLDARTLLRALNAELPLDITIHHAKRVADDFHSRFSAASRSYEYSIAHDRVSIARLSQWVLYAALNHDAIREAVPYLIGTHDFESFSKHVPELAHHYCYVYEAEWEQGERVSRFRIRANRFLQGMVRCLVGGLVQVGRGRMSPDDFAAILEEKDRSNAPMLAPPHGLVLTAVGYSREDRATVQRIIDRLERET